MPQNVGRFKKGLCQGNLRRDLDPLQAFERAAHSGFHGLELRLDADGRVELPSPYDEPDHAAELARSVGLELPSTMGPQFVDLFHKEPDESLPEIMRRTERGLQSAKALGATAILQIPGYVQVAWNPASPIVPYDVAYDRSLRIYRELKALAERYEVTLCVENVWNRFLLSPLEMRAFIDEIGSPCVQAYFDVGNVLAYGFPEQWLRILDRRVAKIHLKDFKSAIGNLQGFTMLLEGNVNWAEVGSAIGAIGYSGYLTAEYGPYVHAPDTLLSHLSASMDAIIEMIPE